jgi:hypothetical protein
VLAQTQAASNFAVRESLGQALNDFHLSF